MADFRQKLQDRGHLFVGNGKQEIGVVLGVAPKDGRHSVQDLDLRIDQTRKRGLRHQSNQIQVKDVASILKQFANLFRDFIVLLRVFYEAWSIDDGQRERDVEVLVEVDVVDGDAIRLRRSLLNQLEAEQVIASDFEDVVDHGVDQCRFARSCDAHKQNRFIFTMFGMAAVAENETINFGPRFAGFRERYSVKIHPAMTTDLLASIPDRFNGPNIPFQRRKLVDVTTNRPLMPVSGNDKNAGQVVRIRYEIFQQTTRFS